MLSEETDGGFLGTSKRRWGLARGTMVCKDLHAGFLAWLHLPSALYLVDGIGVSRSNSGGHARDS